jgi:hypothetical protein
MESLIESAASANLILASSLGPLMGGRLSIGVEHPSKNRVISNIFIVFEAIFIIDSAVLSLAL